jgi:hypothetical protein
MDSALVIGLIVLGIFFMILEISSSRYFCRRHRRPACLIAA